MADRDLERDATRRRLLGWSAACPPLLPGLDHGRDVVIEDGDLARVHSIDCLGQSLSIALTTALGSDVFNTSFGFDGLNALVEESEPVLVRERVRVSVVQVLRNEPRVRQVLDVNLGDERLRPAATGTLDVAVSFETVSLDQATIELGRVTPVG